MNDMEAVDPEYYKSLVWIMENNIEDVLDLTFSTEMDEFGQVVAGSSDACLIKAKNCRLEAGRSQHSRDE
jgi:hypothetical protein